MSQVWFTSDTHFNHLNILRFRKYGSLVEMNEGIVENWNRVIRPGDRVYHLGDVAFGCKRQARQIVSRLNGQKYLIRGNHDKVAAKLADLFIWVRDYEQLKIDGQKIILSHYAFRVWNCCHRGSWNLHGHSHGNLADTGLPQMDVGVDCWNFTPVSFEQVREYMANRSYIPVDHHA